MPSGGNERPDPGDYSASERHCHRAGGTWACVEHPLGLIPLPGQGFLPPDTAPNVLILSEGFKVGERADLPRPGGPAGQKARRRRQDEPIPRAERPHQLLRGLRRFSGVRNLSAQPCRARSGARLTRTRRRRSTWGSRRPTLGTTPPTIAPPPTPATNTRFLLNELDTAFGAVLGERPRAQRFDEIRTAAPSPRRFDEQDFDDFLLALKDPAGQRCRQALEARREGRGGGPGALPERPLRRRQQLPAASGSIICLPLGVEKQFHIQPAAGTPGQDVIADPLPARIHVEMRTRAAHELAHSFTLARRIRGRRRPARRLRRRDRDHGQRSGARPWARPRRRAAPSRPARGRQARRGPNQVALAAHRESGRAQRRADSHPMARATGCRSAPATRSRAEKSSG